MESSYAVTWDDENYVKVSGTLKDDGRVKVIKNENEYIYDTSKGRYVNGVTDASLYTESGWVEEGVNSQEIHLPDGTKIEKKLNETKVILPNGTTVVDDLGSKVVKKPDETSITTKTDDDSSSIQISVTKQYSTESDTERGKLMAELFYRPIPGFFTTIFLIGGVVFGIQLLLYIGPIIYFAFLVPVLMKFSSYILLSSFDVSPNTETENESEEDTEDDIENLQQKYVDGEISELQFEDELEDLLQDNEEKRNLEIETT